MSMPSARIRCTGCDYETVEPRRPILLTYRLPDGTQVGCGRDKGWCYECDDYRDIERADPVRLRSELEASGRRVDALRAELAELSRGLLGWFRNRFKRSVLRSTLAYVDDERRDLNDVLRVAQQRTSRPRCLQCWSENTVPVSFHENGLSAEFVHGCGGRLQFLEDARAERFSFATTRFVLDVEGRLLEEREED